MPDRVGRLCQATVRWPRTCAHLPGPLHPPHRHLKSRLLHVDDAAVTFRYKDYRARRPRSLTLCLEEFTRRFLLHIVPKGFVRIRYYGFLAHAGRARLLSLCRRALGQPKEPIESVPQGDEAGECFLLLLPHRPRLCPRCGKSPLRCVEVFARPPPSSRWLHVAA